MAVRTILRTPWRERRRAGAERNTGPNGSGAMVVSAGGAGGRRLVVEGDVDGLQAEAAATGVDEEHDRVVRAVGQDVFAVEAGELAGVDGQGGWVRRRTSARSRVALPGGRVRVVAMRVSPSRRMGSLPWTSVPWMRP